MPTKQKPKPFDFNVSEQDAAEVNAWLSALFGAGALDSADLVGGGKASAVEFAKTRSAALLTRGSGETPLDTLQELVQGKLAEAVEQGSSLAQFEASLRETLAGDSSARAALIARTESKNAYNHGAATNYREQGVERVEIADGSGMGDICDEENGDVVTIDEFVARSDARHPNCLPAGVVVSAPQGMIEIALERSYEGQVVVLRTAAGDVFTSTPDHPVLTCRGWVYAREITQDDYLIRCLNPQGILGLVDPDHEDVPAVIEEIVSALLKTGSVSPGRMPCSTEELNGDGVDSKICVVGADCEFGHGIVDADASQEYAEFSMQRRPVGAGALLADGAPTEILETTLAAADDVVGGLGVAALVCGASQGHGEFGRLSGPSDHQPKPTEIPQERPKVDADLLGEFCAAFPGEIASVGDSDLVCRAFASRWTMRQAEFPGSPVDGIASDIKSLGDALCRLAAFIEPSKVVEVNVHTFVGHVYNLQVASGWYVANNIVAHNCTIAMIPVLDGLDESEEE